jgi:hypothetical protein
MCSDGLEPYQIPTTNIREEFPIETLIEIGKDEREGYVLNIPIAIMTDQTQMIEQLYHKKPIIAGYMSYAAYDNNTLKFIETSPGLEWLDCNFKSQYLEDSDVKRFLPQNAYADVLADFLGSQNIFWVIINKQSLKVKCERLNYFYEEGLSVSPRYKLIGENDNVAAYAVVVQDDLASPTKPYVFVDRAGYTDLNGMMLMSFSNLGFQITTARPRTIQMSFTLAPLSEQRQLRFGMNDFEKRFVLDKERVVTFELPLYYGINWLYLKNLDCEPDVETKKCEEVVIKDIKIGL